MSRAALLGEPAKPRSAPACQGNATGSIRAGRAVRFQLPASSPGGPGGDGRAPAETGGPFRPVPFREAAIPARDAAVQQARARWRAVRAAVEAGRHVPQWGVTYESGP
ncbi:hypothetical protein FOA52_001502 [Chlamydomonas sp. UWO 241]|nr:hypothetical protein FOA52_001502 [Chlamydomonas sp. UWO 241]